MFWYILGIICLVLLVVGIVLCKVSWRFDDLGFWVSAIAGTTLFFIVLFVPIVTVQNKKGVEVFKRQKEYIENHISDNELEDVAITTKKIELNDWLFDAQYSKTHYSFFSLYSDEVLLLEPIR